MFSRQRCLSIESFSLQLVVSKSSGVGQSVCNCLMELVSTLINILLLARLLRERKWVLLIVHEGKVRTLCVTGPLGTDALDYFLLL